MAITKLDPARLLGAGSIVQVVFADFNTSISTTAIFQYDDTIPQNTEGAEILTIDITPKATSNILVIEGLFSIGNSGAIHTYLGLFKDSDADALSVSSYNIAGNNIAYAQPFFYQQTAGSTSTQTFKIRMAVANNTGYTNRDGGNNRQFGGVVRSSLRITEIAV